MADKDKKPSYLIWILIAAGILILVIGIGFYMLWRKSSASEVKTAIMDKTVSDIRLKVAQLEELVKTKDEKMQDLVKEIGDLKQKNTELTYQIKELKKNNTGTYAPRSGSNQRAVKKAPVCDENGCSDVVDDLE